MFTIFPQIIPKYNCTYCDIKTDNKKDYNKHLLTTKHQKVSKCLHNFPIIFLCSVCNKEYSCRQSLYSHKKKCIIKNTKRFISQSTFLIKFCFFIFSKHNTIFNKHFFK